jgi:hypothetical protein
MIKFFLDGQECEPYNRQDIKYSIDFTSRRRLSQYEISIDVLEFVREDYTRIFNWLKTYGRYQGMPLDVQFSNGQIQRYYLDFTDPSTKWTNTVISVGVKRRNATDNFFDNADSLVFDLVNFNDSDFSKIKYIIIPPNREIYFITISLTTFQLAQQLAQAKKDVKEAISDLNEVLPPVLANLGAIAAAAIKVAARIVYLVAITIALIRLITDLIKIVFPPVREFKCITYKNLIKKSCEYLGYTLESNVLNQLDKLTVVPVPLRPNNFSVIREVFAPQSIAFTNGYPSALDVISTLGTAISTLEEIFNLTTSVNNGVVKIERNEDFDTLDSDPVQLAYNIQDLAQEERTFNDEYWKRKLMFWAKDGADFNTYDDRNKTIVEFDTSVQVSPHEDIQLLKGLEQVPTNFSRATRKEGLDFIEKTLKVLTKAVDLFTGGAISNAINNREGVMILSQQYFSNTKLIWAQGDKISPQDKEILNPETIINNYHQNLQVVNNTTEVIQNMPIRIDELSFLQFVNKNFVTLTDGKRAELKRLEWSETDVEGSLTFEIPSDYAININETKINNG